MNDAPQSDASRGRVRVEPGLKRVRAYLEGRLAADTLHPLLVWEKPFYPTYYVPLSDVSAALEPTGGVEKSPSRGNGLLHDVRVGDRTAKGAAITIPDSPLEPLRDAVRLDFAAFDWFEEDEPIYTHPRDPYSRVDILGSSRRVRVELDGVTIAESHRPQMLFETGLPVRYYLPITDYRTELLVPSDSETHCPYKGTATYWSVKVGDTVHEDIVWIYRSPFPESQKIAGFAAPYNERVDIYLDDVLQERPKKRF